MVISFILFSSKYKTNRFFFGKLFDYAELGQTLERNQETNQSKTYLDLFYSSHDRYIEFLNMSLKNHNAVYLTNGGENQKEFGEQLATRIWLNLENPKTIQQMNEAMLD